MVGRGETLSIDLSWPAEQLSPNSRAHYMVVARYKKAAKTEAGWATRIAMPHDWEPSSTPIPVELEAHPPKAWRTGDADNLIARCKAAIDGISAVIGINDREFAAPTVTWADRCDRGKLIVRIG